MSMSYGTSDMLYIAIIAVIFLVVDAVWLYIMRDVFGGMISRIQGGPVSIKAVPAFVTYIIMTIGLYHFIVKEGRSPLQAVLLGLFVYGIYEGTNYSILKDWEIKVAVYDTLWGGTLFGIVTYLFYIIHKAINK